MDFKKIFIQDANPTKIGGQAVLEGIMMKSDNRSAVVIRADEDHLYIKTEKLAPRSKVAQIPIIRGVYIFISSLMTGMKTLMDSNLLIRNKAARQKKGRKKRRRRAAFRSG